MHFPPKPHCPLIYRLKLTAQMQGWRKKKNIYWVVCKKTLTFCIKNRILMNYQCLILTIWNAMVKNDALEGFNKKLLKVF